MSPASRCRPLACCLHPNVSSGVAFGCFTIAAVCGKLCLNREGHSMSRTRLFAVVNRALAQASHESGIVFLRSSALTRRSLLRLSAAAAGAAALLPVTDWSAYAKKPERHKKPKPQTVAIVGGGVAGLTAATDCTPQAPRRFCSRLATVGVGAC